MTTSHELTAPTSALPPEPVPRRAPVRDRYFDLLRAVALFRVVFYHLMGWAWLPVVFPSMGVMFALAGNLMARSLKRPAVDVVRGRLRRLLPPLWLLGALGVSGMVLQGWRPDAEGHPGWWFVHLGFWVLPLSDPPYAGTLPGAHGVLGPDWAAELAGPLWYIRAYLWFVLLSPLLLAALRAIPWTTVLAPVALAAAFEFGHLQLPGERIPSALTDFSTFGACWILGMAHQQGVLKRIPRYVVPSVAPIVAGLGLWYALTHGFRQGHDLDDIPFAQCLWSLATVLLLLHISPTWSEWPRLLRPFDRLVTLLNSRAVTIYLWHNLCILIASTLWDQLWRYDVLDEKCPWLLESPWPVLALTWVLICGCVVTFGWAEDLAARRKPQLWPDGHPSPASRHRAA
ncbi:acyltransferase [Streptomyces griseoluteus]|uniref:Acyltransferase n=1 Tax=Streptomyces griseoluteus TaxID=29306 RepID=A0A4Z1D5B8_STRGP|nr:acyltransferase family protein [Streptomyces griseoluteus]TGN77358.1 acyltransferase [Streptomyces griseoluteus]GHF26116.1 membrane protein [Streptomyces griseoluteus]